MVRTLILIRASNTDFESGMLGDMIWRGFHEENLDQFRGAFDEFSFHQFYFMNCKILENQIKEF